MSTPSALVLGTAQLGAAYGIANTAGRPDARTAARLLRVAAEVGVTQVDTARAYGLSERRIGGAIRDPAMPSLHIITKVAPLPVSVLDVAGVARHVTDSVRRSVSYLGSVRSLTILLHRASDASAGAGTGWRRLREVAADGAADRIGVSVRSPRELLEALDLPDLGYVQLPCNVLDRRWLDAGVDAALAARPDVVVTARSVFLQGLLSAGTAVPWPNLDPAARDRVVTALDAAAARLGRADRLDLCVAFVRSLPWVSAVVIGAETEAQVRANAALVAASPLSPAEREDVLASVPAGPDDLVDPSQWP